MPAPSHTYALGGGEQNERTGTGDGATEPPHNNVEDGGSDGDRDGEGDGSMVKGTTDEDCDDDGDTDNDDDNDGDNEGDGVAEGDCDVVAVHHVGDSDANHALSFANVHSGHLNDGC